ncbi:MAG: DUF5654 family protein [bacterium]|nr:DUF5654 family protein [bacterium]
MINQPAESANPDKKSGITFEIREKTLGYVTAGLGLVAGLAWNDAIKSFIEFIFPKKGNSVSAKFVYALLITLAVVTLTAYLVRILGRKNK